jgi:hypothetical protein
MIESIGPAWDKIGVRKVPTTIRTFHHTKIVPTHGQTRPVNKQTYSIHATPAPPAPHPHHQLYLITRKKTSNERQ